MAEATAEARAAPDWMFVNEVRVIAFVLGASMVVLLLGMGLYLADGPDQADTVDVLLGTGVFFILFAVVLFVPRIRSRGPKSFTLLIERDMDDVEVAVTAAIEEGGHRWDLTRRKSRFARPPRDITVDGASWKFTLRAAPYRENRRDGTEWTELVQAGLPDETDEAARDARERVLRRLTAPVR